MDEEEVQRKRRDAEEQATSRRARILGFPYLDTRMFEEDIPLVMDLLTKEDMHKYFIIPFAERQQRNSFPIYDYKSNAKIIY